MVGHAAWEVHRRETDMDPAVERVIMRCIEKDPQERPASVDAVLGSGIPVTMIPLDATDRVPVTQAWFASLSRHHTTPAARAVFDVGGADQAFDFLLF